MSEERCPKCGAEKSPRPLPDGKVGYECGSFVFTKAWEHVGVKAGYVSESDHCLRNQLAAANAKIERLRAAVEACLLFHDSGDWDIEKQLGWYRLTRSPEATTKVLCETARAALGQEEER
jgi:hypothetical protein